MLHKVTAPYTKPYFWRHERLDANEHLVLERFGRRELIATWVRRDQPELGMTLPNASSDVFLTCINLRPLQGDDLFCDGRHLRRPDMAPGALAVLDQRHAWVTNMAEPFESIHVYVSATSLRELTEELHAPQIETLECPIQSAHPDPVMHHLALALLPALKKPHEANALFVEQMFATIRMVLAQTYGGLERRRERAHGGLAPWQERRAKEMLMDELQADHSLSDLAAACGLSIRHFARAFKRTTGMPPHQWLLRQRVERGKQLLANTDDELSEIALRCGFADQSHLSRVFRARVGTTPDSWRRQQACAKKR